MESGGINRLIDNTWMTLDTSCISSKQKGKFPGTEKINKLEKHQMVKVPSQKKFHDINKKSSAVMSQNVKDRLVKA